MTRDDYTALNPPDSSSRGFRPGRAFATAAGLAEVGGGLLLALGFLGRPVPRSSSRS